MFKKLNNMMDKLSSIVLSLLAGVLFSEGYLWIAFLIIIIATYWVVSPALLFGEKKDDLIR